MLTPDLERPEQKSGICEKIEDTGDTFDINGNGKKMLNIYKITFDNGDEGLTMSGRFSEGAQAIYEKYRDGTGQVRFKYLGHGTPRITQNTYKEKSNNAKTALMCAKDIMISDFGLRNEINTKGMFKLADKMLEWLNK